VSYRELEKLAQGRVYTGRMALKNGLIDRLGTLRDALAEAKKAAGLQPSEKVELLILPEPTSIFEQLFGPSTVSSQLASTAPELVEAARKTRLFRRLFTERVLTWMPYSLELR